MSESSEQIAKDELASHLPLSLKQRLVAWSAAMLLLTAALLKAWPMATGQAIDTQVASLGKLILIQGEILLALWLISGINAAWAFRAAMVFFAGAALVNLRSIWLGEVSCGCFGIVEVPPRLTLSLNVVLLTLLALTRPLAELNSNRSSTHRVRLGGRLASICLSVVVLSAAGTFARDYRRTAMFEAPIELDLGTLEPGQKKTIALSLRNKKNKAITIVGAKSSCTCALVEGLPKRIEAGATQSVSLLFTVPHRPSLSGNILLYSDDSGDVLVSFTGIIDTHTSRGSSLAKSKQ